MILESMDSSHPVGGAALAVDLSSQKVKFVLTPADSSGKGETLSAKTTEFARSQGVQIAINGSPYAPMDFFNRSNRPVDIIGIQMNKSLLQSQGVASFDALYILDDGSIEFGSQKNQPPNTMLALGGFHMLLEDGVILGTRDSRHPRTSIGLSEDRETLYLAVFDGRQKDRVGLTSEETALWMQWLGCHHALNLDGGGSSTLVLEDETGKVQLLNNPVHRGLPGLERAVGNHLGIKLIK
jgi:exopolysaccharide biosynthesis protein